MNRFGQCCLLARRLIEAGVRFVTVNTFLTVFDDVSWDIHGSKPFTSIEGMKQQVHRCMIRLLGIDSGFAQRGMLDDTMVCNLAEFGRTPKVNPAGGRDHWPQCFTFYFAGGGVQGGRVVERVIRLEPFRLTGQQSHLRLWPRFSIRLARPGITLTWAGRPPISSRGLRLSRNPRIVLGQSRTVVRNCFRSVEPFSKMDLRWFCCIALHPSGLKHRTKGYSCHHFDSSGFLPYLDQSVR